MRDTNNVQLPKRKPKPRNTAWRFVTVWGRLIVTGLALIGQLIFFGWLLTWGQELSPWLATVSFTISILVLTLILHSKRHTEYKLIWAILILVLPLFGGVFYVLFGSRTGTVRQLQRYRAAQNRVRLAQLDAPGVIELPSGRTHRAAVLTDEAAVENAQPQHPLHRVEKVGLDARHELTFLANIGPYMAYQGSQTKYYPLGELAFDDILDALGNAKRWISLEFFIISDGDLWDAIHDILERKIKAGVEVRILYDDFGSFWNLPAESLRELSALGAIIKPVNKLGPGLTLRYNNRDHRKLVIIDGLVAFTGGINIGDEYINEKVRFGHWKDTAMRISGPGAWGVATLFFSFWDEINHTETDLAKYRPSAAELSEILPGSGVLISFDDSPLDDYSIGWAAYRNAMMRAHRKVDIATPYLVPSQEMINFFQAVALSGVRVRLIVPGIPDKWFVNQVAKSNYRALVEAGVEVYEYSPGFIHAKQMLVDGESAIIGTINFDYRSFYLHQENAVWLYQTESIDQMAEDFEHTIGLSRRITLEQVRATPAYQRGFWLLLRTFAPLL